MEKVEEKKEERATYEEVLEDVKKLIEDKKINNIEDVKEYVKKASLCNTEKEKLCNEAKTYINGEEKESDITQVRNQIIGIIRTSRSKDEHLFIKFNVSLNNVGSSLCRIDIDWLKKNHVKTYKMNSFYYNEEFKKQMIEAIIDEVVLDNYIDDYGFNQSDSQIDTLYNFYLNTLNNIHIDLFDIEKDYAYYLRSKINELYPKKRKDCASRKEAMEDDGIVDVFEDRSLSRIRVKESSY